MFTAEFPTSGEKVAVKKFIGHEDIDERVYNIKILLALKAYASTNMHFFSSLFNSTLIRLDLI